MIWIYLEKEVIPLVHVTILSFKFLLLTLILLFPCQKRFSWAENMETIQGFQSAHCNLLTLLNVNKL